ncbi:ribosome small subunit-dependent GTPase A [Rubellimicrobium roseum]|uniref:Small ribosomal subunit biogenesis GTPase RsgA n=1 Tax=Rubellimicrobium roseum TaxID=687525 RepID=A0A5C4NHJ8_9RHOB|nr:ribosome small subunit-dependent GTPase A [Rubellimicrobium roseum]TNC74093.1 ribosome small subunit-dependent GTPase A [Rubellimicrobium roseum]
MIETDLSSLGWTSHFARQIDAAESLSPARVAEVQRSHLTVLPGSLRLQAPEGTGRFAVGDWLLHDGERAFRRLDPLTEIARKGAGEGAEKQLIVANVDTLGIVTSCNADFSPARLERYLAVAMTAGSPPLVILTKADQAEDPEGYLREARRLSPLVTAITLNATDPEEVARLHPWCGSGRTLALVGSSGVGKTTIQNALTGVEAATQAIREDDARGRHTTTARSLRLTLAGGCLIDTPGMRELGMLEAAEGISAVFADIEELGAGCRFRDCAHEAEPGCAVQAAIAAGELDANRLERYRKLEREDRLHTESLHEKHARSRAWAKATLNGSARSRWKRRGPEED